MWLEDTYVLREEGCFAHFLQRQPDMSLDVETAFLTGCCFQGFVEVGLSRVNSPLRLPSYLGCRAAGRGCRKKEPFSHGEAGGSPAPFLSPAFVI